MSGFKINTQNQLYVYIGFPSGLDGKESASNAGHLVQSLGQKDPLEKEMATHPSILAWRILWTEEPVGLEFAGSQRVRHDRAVNTLLLLAVSIFTYCQKIIRKWDLKYYNL